MSTRSRNLTAAGFTRRETGKSVGGLMREQGVDVKAGFDFEVWQDGAPVASAHSMRRDDALREAQHYAMMYSQDGATTIYEVHRTVVIEMSVHKDEN